MGAVEQSACSDDVAALKGDHAQYGNRRGGFPDGQFRARGARHGLQFIQRLRRRVGLARQVLA